MMRYRILHVCCGAGGGGLGARFVVLSLVAVEPGAVIV